MDLYCRFPLSAKTITYMNLNTQATVKTLIYINSRYRRSSGTARDESIIDSFKAGLEPFFEREADAKIY